MLEMKFKVPRCSLDENKVIRRDFLDEYFPSGLIPFEQSSGSDWEITGFTAQDPSSFVDPNIEANLKRWQHPIAIENIGAYRSFYKNCMISFSDSWSIYYWSLLASCFNFDLKENHFTLFHLDDHKDLGSPHLIKGNLEYSSILNEKRVSFLSPDTIKNAVNSMSIGIDSFIVPLLEAVNSLDIFHLKYSFQGEDACYGLKLINHRDSLLAEGMDRPSVNIEAPNEQYSYLVSRNLFNLASKMDPDCPVFLHIDCDVFNNRYNLDSNWDKKQSSIDLNLDQIKIKISELVDLFGNLTNPVYLNIALSPGFFPSEYWIETCDFLINSFERAGIIKEDLFCKYISEHHPQELFYETTSSW